jgi:hypothetical protein
MGFFQAQLAGLRTVPWHYNKSFPSGS